MINQFKIFNLLLVGLMCQGALLGCSKKDDSQAESVNQVIEYQEIDWEDLIPKEERYDPNNMNQEQNMILQSFGYSAPANAVESLDGQYIKLPGFIVPLEMQGDQVTEFLLVPYYGACIHSPPPPKNQIIYVKSDAFTLEDTYLAFWVEGQLSVEDTDSDLGNSGYLLKASAITLYE